MESAGGRLANAVPDGLRLRLKVQPKARRNGIVGVGSDRDGPALRVAVNAPP